MTRPLTPPRFAACALLTILFAATAMNGRMHAATIPVTTLDDSGPGSLRQAIADAAAGDTITFAVTGTITLTSGQIVIDKHLTIEGPGAPDLTVSGNHSSRIFYVSPPFPAAVTITNITIRDGKEEAFGDPLARPRGGAIFAVRNRFDGATASPSARPAR